MCPDQGTSEKREREKQGQGCDRGDPWGPRRAVRGRADRPHGGPSAGAVSKPLHEAPRPATREFGQRDLTTETLRGKVRVQPD